MKRRVPAMPPKNPRPSTSVSGTPRRAASATSGVWAENGIARRLPQLGHLARRSATGSSTFAMSNGSKSASARFAVSRRQPMFASRRSSRSGPIAARISRTSAYVLLDRVDRRPCPRTPESPCSSTMRAQNAATSAGRLLEPGPVGEVLAERDLGSHRSAEQLVERHPGLARRDVPERDLDSGERARDDHLRVTAMLDGRRLEPTELGEHVTRVTPDECLTELAAQGLRVGRRGGLPQPDDAVLGRHPHDRPADTWNDPRTPSGTSPRAGRSPARPRRGRFGSPRHPARSARRGSE